MVLGGIGRKDGLGEAQQERRRLHDARVDETGESPEWDEAAAELWIHDEPEHLRDIREEGEGVGSERPSIEGGEHGSTVEAVYAQGGQFEPRAEGKPQQLIPGVKPVTDKERAELAADKPLRGVRDISTEGDIRGGAPGDEGGGVQNVARNQRARAGAWGEGCGGYSLSKILD